MKKITRIFILSAVAVGLGLTSCGTRKLSVVDKIYLNATAMRFDHTGAELAECTLVSQLERGRSSATSGGGAG